MFLLLPDRLPDAGIGPIDGIQDAQQIQQAGQGGINLAVILGASVHRVVPFLSHLTEPADNRTG